MIREMSNEPVTTRIFAITRNRRKSNLIVAHRAGCNARVKSLIALLEQDTRESNPGDQRKEETGWKDARCVAANGCQFLSKTCFGGFSRGIAQFHHEEQSRRR